MTLTIEPPSQQPGEAEQEEFSREELKNVALRGLKWVSSARAAAEVVAVGVGIAMAHLVPPAAFGRVSVAILVNELALGLANEGVGSPLVQRRLLNRAHVESAALVGIAMGLILMLLTIFAVPFITTPLFGHATTQLFQLYAPVFALAGFAIVPLALLQRRLDFRRISLIEITQVLVTAAASITLALEGLDAQAYVLGAVIGAAAWAILLVLAAPKVVPRWHRLEMVEITRFGLPAGLAGLAQVGQRNADYLILGARLAAAQVGFYYRGFTIGVGYEQKISGIVNRILFPLYSRTEDTQHMLEVRHRVTRLNAALIFPLLCFFIAVAPVALPLVFGEAWRPAVQPAQILALAGMIATVSNATGALMLAAGQPRRLFSYQLALTTVYAAGVFIASSHGLTAVCITVVAIQFVALLAAYHLMLRRATGLSLSTLARDLAPALGASAVMLAVAWPLREALSGAGVAAIPMLIITTPIAAVLYLAAMWKLSPAVWRDLGLLATHMISRRREKRSTGTRPAAPDPTVTAPGAS
jgi:O-antigen/teichoic acid export membrane protein